MCVITCHSSLVNVCHNVSLSTGQCVSCVSHPWCLCVVVCHSPLQWSFPLYFSSLNATHCTIHTRNCITSEGRQYALQQLIPACSALNWCRPDPVMYQMCVTLYEQYFYRNMHLLMRTVCTMGFTIYSNASVTVQPPSSVKGGCTVTKTSEFIVKAFGQCVPDDHDSFTYPATQSFTSLAT